MSDLSKDASDAVKNGKSAVANAVDTASQTASDMVGKVRDAGQQAAGYMRDQYDHLGDRAHEAYDQAKHKAHDWEQSFEGYVQQKPLQSILIAAGVGVLLGLLWKRHD